MVQLSDVLLKIEVNERTDVEKTVDETMKRICCEEVNWRKFYVYQDSISLMVGILSKFQIHFLIPIAEEAKKDKEREISIICCSTNQNYDEIHFVRINETKILARIDFSRKTAKKLLQN